jgi:hypothetical protein
MNIDFDIGDKFSKDPVGRFYNENKGSSKKNNISSGEAFREEKLRGLLDNLVENQKINFILDNDVEAYGSSFLVEGFAGIVKYGYMESDLLLSKIEFQYSDPDFEFYENKIKQYIQEAKFNCKTYESTKDE